MEEEESQPDAEGPARHRGPPEVLPRNVKVR